MLKKKNFRSSIFFFDEFRPDDGVLLPADTDAALYCFAITGGRGVCSLNPPHGNGSLRLSSYCRDEASLCLARKKNTDVGSARRSTPSHSFLTDADEVSAIHVGSGMKFWPLYFDSSSSLSL